jgi:hypothetical protein
MPKDSHLLPQHSQDLLRAARSGRIYKRPAPPEEEDADPEVIEKQEKKDDDSKETGFSARAWKQIPRQQEGPDLEYLAKRRKGLITYSKPLPPVPTVVKTTVRRTDAAGNQYTQDVVVPHGQQVDGEVVAQTVIPDPSLAPVPEAFSVQPTPPKRNRPIQKKRPKGPGRGRKKKILPPTSVPQAIPVDGVIPSGGNAPTVVGPDGIKTEPEDSATPGNTINEDTEMGEGSMAASDDEDGDEDGDEGDDDEGSVEDQSSPSKPHQPISPPPAPLPTMKEIPDTVPTPTFSTPTNPLIAHLEKERSFDGKSGSPLKNVALATSALASPMVSPTVTAPPSFPDISAAAVESLTTTLTESEAIVENLQAERANIDIAMQIDVAESAPTAIPSPPPAPSEPEIQAAEILRKEEEEEEEMILDVVENTNAYVASEIKEQSSTYTTELANAPSPTPATVVTSLEEPQNPLIEAKEEIEVPPIGLAPSPIEDIKAQSSPAQEPQIEPPALAIPEQPVETEDEDDDFPDLLGGLEKSLGQPAPPSTMPTVPASVVEESSKAETQVDAPVDIQEEKKLEEN